jgi:Protease inhibitor Inh
MIQLAKPVTWTIALLAPLALVDCTGSRSGFSDPFASPQAAAPSQPAAPPINMAGRWLLASPSGGVCGMTFTAGPDATSGKVAPEGGCPGKFFTSRQWSLDQGALVISDHKERSLARLAAAGPTGPFQGQAASGISVTLSR